MAVPPFQANKYLIPFVPSSWPAEAHGSSAEMPSPHFMVDASLQRPVFS